MMKRPFAQTVCYPKRDRKGQLSVPARSVALLTSLVFLVFSVFGGLSFGDVIPAGTGLTVQEGPRDLLPELRDSLFTIPSALGSVEDVHVGNNGKIVIHVQDAHCDYYAQRTIRDLITHFRENYGVGLLCLEGGAGNYDLSPFTSIEDEALRGRVADFFVKQGMLNGAELAGVEDPEAFELWGMENEELYIKNLEIYRESGSYRVEVEEYLGKVKSMVTALKKHIYPEELYRLDRKQSEYRDNELPLQDYIKFLIEEAHLNGMPVKTLSNIYLLKQVIDMEAEIDFAAANKEREGFIEALRGQMTPNRQKELMGKLLLFGKGDMPQKEFYNYLLVSAKEYGIQLAEYPELRKFIVYISLYTSIDKSHVMVDLEKLEDELKDDLCCDDTQKELVRYSKDLEVMEGAFDFSLTKHDFEYLSGRMGQLKMSDVTSFMERQAERAGVDIDIPDNGPDIAAKIHEISGFYTCSFKRDEVFVEKISSKMDKTACGSALIITGGFHTESLLKMLRDKGYSYVSVVPYFEDAEGYACPYFNILGGGRTDLGEKIAQSVAGSNLQVASIWNRLGIRVEGEQARNLAEIQVDIITRVLRDGKAVLEVGSSGTVMEFFLGGDGTVDYRVRAGTAGDEVIADVRITDTEEFTYEDHEKIIDSQLAMAWERGDVEILGKDSPILRSAADFFNAIGRSEIARRISSGGIRAYSARGIAGFKGHASHNGVYVSGGLSVKEQAATLVHEIGAYMRQSHKLNLEMERLYDRYALGGKAAIATADLSVFGDMDDTAAISVPGAFEERDYADRLVEEGDADIPGQGTARGGHLLTGRDIEETDGHLRIVAQDRSLRVIEGPRRIDKDLLEDIRSRNKNVPFADTAAIADFLSGWEIVTVQEDTEYEKAGGTYFAAAVDEANGKLYVNETLNNAALIAPRILPVIILAQVFSPGSDVSELAGRFDMPASVDPSAVMRGISRDRIKILGLAMTLNDSYLDGFRGETPGDPTDPFTKLAWKIEKMRAEFRERGRDDIPEESLRDLERDEFFIVEANRINGAVSRRQRCSGVMDLLFGGLAMPEKAWKAVNNMDGTSGGNIGLARVVYSMEPRSWVVFADVMAGRARAKYLGEGIMDVLRPEATRTIVRVARDHKVLAYHFGADEHVFLFGEDATDLDIEDFYLTLSNELRNDSEYVLFTTRPGQPAIPSEAEEALSGISSKKEHVPGAYHILVSRQDLEAHPGLASALDGHLDRLDIFPFFVPAGVARDVKASSRGLHWTLDEAESAVGKWRQEEVDNLLRMRTTARSSFEEFWEGISPRKKAALEKWARSKMGVEADHPISEEDILFYGLPGLPKSMIAFRDIEGKRSPRSSAGKAVMLTGIDSFEDTQKKARTSAESAVAAFFKGVRERTGRVYRQYDTDSYTGYGKDALQDLLRELFMMTEDERKALPADQRIFVLRGPPIDLFIVSVNDNGGVCVVNVDGMVHAEHLAGAGKDAVKEELSEGLGGRLTDYVVLEREYTRNETLMSLIERVSAAGREAITQEERKRYAEIQAELRAYLEAMGGGRVFPFKAVNSYAGHDVADNYILAMVLYVQEAFAQVMREDGAITADNVKKAVKMAAEKINASLDDEKFAEIIDDDSKHPLRMMLETHMVDEEALTGSSETLGEMSRVPSGEERARIAADRYLWVLKAMSGVRDPSVVLEDGEVVGRYLGRVRRHSESPGMEERYERAYEFAEMAEAHNARVELEVKNEFAEADLEEKAERVAEARREEELRAEHERSAQRVTAAYEASKNVIGNVKIVRSPPLVVAVPCAFESESAVTGMKNKVKRRISEKYGTDNIEVVLYSSRSDLETSMGSSAISAILSDPAAKAVVYCVEGDEVHPAETGPEERILGEVNAGVYYINESFGLGKGAYPDRNLVGPHVALALGIVEFDTALKEGRDPAPSLLHSMNVLLSEISGGNIAIAADPEQIVQIIRDILNGLAIKIEKIDFDTLRDQIEAEEAALKSL